MGWNGCGMVRLRRARSGAVSFAFLVPMLLMMAGAAYGFSPHPHPIRIMPLGDSITIGIGDASLQGYRREIYRALVKHGYDIDLVGDYRSGQSNPMSFDDDHQGTGGQTKEQLADIVHGNINDNPADIVLLHTGTNSPSVDPDPVETILDEIDRFSTSTKVILARIINKYVSDGSPISTITAFNNNVAAMVQARTDDDISIVDMQGQILYPVHYDDLIHPNRSGYQKMTDIWLEALLDTLPAPQGMTSYWMLEDASGSTFSDAKLLNHGQCSSDCPFPGTGRVGDGQVFSPSTCIEVDPDDTFDWTDGDSYTIELWFKKERAQTDGREIMVGRSSSDGEVRWMIGVMNDDTDSVVFFSMKGSATPSEEVMLTGKTPVLDDEWHHVALVRDAGSEMKWKLYFDGVEEDQYAGSFRKAFDSDSPLCFGNLRCDGGQEAHQFIGMLDEIAVYNRPISRSEVSTHYRNGFSDEGYYYTGRTIPYIKPITLTSVREGDTYSYAVQSVGNPEPELTLLNSPAGMTIDRSGLLRWRTSTAGSFDVEIRAVNAIGSFTREFTITVSPTGAGGDPEPSGGSSGGGCLFDGYGTFGIEWLLLFLVPGIARLRRQSTR